MPLYAAFFFDTVNKLCYAIVRGVMKIKLHQPCLQFTTPTFWMAWTNSQAIPHLFDGWSSSDPYVVRIQAVRSELLKELAK